MRIEANMDLARPCCVYVAFFLLDRGVIANAEHDAVCNVVDSSSEFLSSGGSRGNSFLMQSSSPLLAKHLSTVFMKQVEKGSIDGKVRMLADKERAQQLDFHSNGSLNVGLMQRPKGGGGGKKGKARKTAPEGDVASSHNFHHAGSHDKMRKGQRESDNSYYQRFMRQSPESIVIKIFGIGLLVAISCLCWTQSEGKQWGGTKDEAIIRGNEALDEDIFGLAIALLVRDTNAIAAGEGKLSFRFSRLVVVLSLVFVCMGLQVFLLLQVRRFVTPGSVRDIRSCYNMFEWHMHGSSEAQVYIDEATSAIRGYKQFFDRRYFDSMSPELKTQVCHIPFSQPVFFLAILYIWTLTCIIELRRCVEFLFTVVICIKTIPALHEMMSSHEGEDSTRVILGLTYRMKFFMVGIIVVPRTLVACELLREGCRWLTSTADFGDLLMNAVALEFILLLKDLLYSSMVPSKNKHDLEDTEVLTKYSNERAALTSFLASFIWGAVSLFWSIIYIFYFQDVLPDYKWDVRRVCVDWLQSI